jgi:thymidylate kinase
MTLHIALDGIDGLGKTTQIKKLKEFLTKKSYNVKTLLPVQDKTISYILNKYNLTFSEKALLTAIDRSLSWNWEDFDQYDIVLWDTSIIYSYAYYTNGNVKPSFIQSINKFSPNMDIIIVIRHCEYMQEQDFSNRVQYDLIQKYDKLIGENDNVYVVDFVPEDPSKVFEEIVKTLFDVLPTCKWCGRLFKKGVFNKRYCSEECKAYAKEEQNRDNFRNYYNRYKDTMTESKRGALGSKGANLHGRANDDPEVEARLISNEKRRLGL